ncbi:MAG: acyltransferase [Nonomuraea sp.]|nr:acyltransferase [Nonomuraea sp.]
MSTSTSPDAGLDRDSLRDRLPSLTGVRFYAAMSVAALHLLYTQSIFADPSLQFAFGATIPLATSAVSVFFVISGFVLTWSARSADTAPLFWRRRLVKIFPNHVVTWVLAMVFLVLYGAQSHMIGMSSTIHWDASVANLFLLHAWVPSPDYINSANSPVWSLACELFFYLLFPALYRMIKKIPRGRLWWWAGGTTLVSLAVPCVAGLLKSPVLAPELPVPTLQLWFGYILPLTRLPEFVLGMLLAVIVGEGLWRPKRARYAVLTLVAFMVVSLLLPPIFLFGPFYAAPAGVLVATLATRDVRALPSHLRSRLMIFLGDRSFALYMSHFVVIAFARQLLLPDDGLDVGSAVLALTLVVLPLVLLAPCLLFAWVERPLYRRFASPRSDPA